MGGDASLVAEEGLGNVVLCGVYEHNGVGDCEVAVFVGQELGATMDSTVVWGADYATVFYYLGGGVCEVELGGGVGWWGPVFLGQFSWVAVCAE